jgi:hypothetical protein
LRCPPPYAPALGAESGMTRLDSSALWLMMEPLQLIFTRLSLAVEPISIHDLNVLSEPSSDVA